MYYLETTIQYNVSEADMLEYVFDISFEDISGSLSEGQTICVEDGELGKCYLSFMFEQNAYYDEVDGLFDAYVLKFSFLHEDADILDGVGKNICQMGIQLIKTLSNIRLGC